MLTKATPLTFVA